MNKTASETNPLVLIGSLVVGFYAWLVAVFFGLSWLDVIYSRLVPDARDAFHAVSDFLLFVLFVIAMAGLAAVLFAWKMVPARLWLIASLCALVGLPFLGAALGPSLADAPTSGAAIRLLVTGGASVLAFAGCRLYAR